MPFIRLVIVGILGFAAAEAHAQPFEQQLFQFSQDTAAMARQNRQIFLNTQAAAVRSQAAWHKVTGPDGTFTAEMPSAPKHTAVTLNGNGSVTPYTLHEYVFSKGASTFVIHTTVFPPEIDRSNAQAGIQTGLDISGRNLDGGKWISTTWTKHQGLTAADSIGLSKGSEHRAYSVIRGQQIFTLTYIGPDGTARSEDANRFLASLNIDFNAPVWQRATATDNTYFIDMPGAPRYSATAARAPRSGAAYTVHRHEVRDQTRTYAIATQIKPAEFDLSNPRAYLQIELDECTTILDGGKWISVTWTNHQGLIAVDAVGLINGRTARMYLVVRGQQMFNVNYVGPDGSARADDVNRFIGSLHIR